MPSRPAIWIGPSRYLQRSRTILRTITRQVRFGLLGSRERRSGMPAGPWAR